MQCKTSVRGAPLLSRKASRPAAARRVPAIRAYVTEKDVPPSQSAGGEGEKIRVGINGEPGCCVV